MAAPWTHNWKKLPKLLCLGLIAFLINQTLWNFAEEHIAGADFSQNQRQKEHSGKQHGKKRREIDGGSNEVMINTYMRSGSSFLGRVLGFRSDTFYVYEPLWSLSRNAYFGIDGQKCETFKPYCKESDEVQVAFQALDQLYNCTFYMDPMLKLVTPNINVKLSGNKWHFYKECKENQHTSVTCLKFMATKVCATSRNKVTKVLRISLANIETFLEARPNLKVVHLFRDPRAMINSHTRTAWSPVRSNSASSIEGAAKSICLRIADDIKYAKILQKKFPERFLILQYEDFDDPVPKISKLYGFLGMNFTTEVFQFIDSESSKSSQNNQHGNHPFLYREQLDWRTLEIVNRHCSDVYKDLGYTMFASEKTFRDKKIPPVTGPLPFALL